MPSRSLVAATLVALLAGAGAGALVLSGGSIPGVTADGESTPTPAVTPAPVPTDTPVSVSESGVPGVTAAGISDPVALARHHDRTLGSNYTLWMDLYWRPATDPDAGWHQRDIDVTVAEDRYLLRAELERAGSQTRLPALSVYRDGETRYAVVHQANGSVTYHRLGPDEPSPARVPEPSALRSGTLAALLDTPLTAYTGPVTRDGESYDRVVATGAPTASLPVPWGDPVPSTAVRNYSAIVLLDTEGRLVTVEAQYTVVDRRAEAADPVTVQFRATYDRRGFTSVTRPPWVDRAVEAGNATDRPARIRP